MKNINVKESSGESNALTKNSSSEPFYKKNGYGGWANLFVF